MRRRPSAGLLLAHRLRRWPNSKQTLGRRLMIAGRGLPDIATVSAVGDVTTQSGEHLLCC